METFITTAVTTSDPNHFLVYREEEGKIISVEPGTGIIATALQILSVCFNNYG
jgi:hypothetical protein